MRLPLLPQRGWVLLVALTAFAVVPLSAAEPRTIADLGLKLMPIPAGSFTMGSPATESGRYDDEGPQTRVTISRAFWLGQTEVTHAQWLAVMGTDLAEQARRMLADDTLYDLRGKYDVGGKEKQMLRDLYRKAKDSDPNALVFNSNDEAPMYWVSWEEAVAFCRRLTERERTAGRLPADMEYRLPNEVEWEYACRAGTTEATYAGEMEIKGKFNAPVLDAIAWYGGNNSVGWTGKGIDATNVAEKQYPGGTAAQRDVATKRPNAWGLHDMIGNVFEWCGDWYVDQIPGGEVRDPSGPALGSRRVIRGGCWGYAARLCRAAYRDGDLPALRRRVLGFRLALSSVR